MTTRERLLRDVERYNAREGNLKGYDCPICKNKGYIDAVVDHADLGYSERMTRRCECMKVREMRRVAAFQLGEYAKKDMNDFIAREDWQKGIKIRAIAYLNDLEPKWFAICGQSGSGKTLICSIIANTIVKQRNKRLIKTVWPDLIGSLKRDAMNYETAKKAGEVIGELKKCDVLFIDEALKRYTETDLKYFSEIVNYRYLNDLPTIMNSEFTSDELLRIDESMFSRVIEKCDIYFINISKDVNKNQRLKKVNGDAVH